MQDGTGKLLPFYIFNFGHTLFFSSYVFCAANLRQLTTIGEESNIMKLFTPKEICKRYAVLLGSSNTKIYESLGIKLKKQTNEKK